MSLRVAVSDAGPLHYLILIGQVDVLPRLFARIVLPSQVREELSRPTTPVLVRAFIQNPPDWLEVVATVNPLNIAGLHDGEAAALALASQLKSEILVDDQAARKAARRLGFRPVGTVAILQLADEERLLDIEQAVKRLRETNFYISPTIIEEALRRRRRH